jgi:HD-GYP domain-containing protein (c-di-GMP phosphodiesterase class II)
MTTARPYRRALRRSDALAELRTNAGRQFDPNVVVQFTAAIEREEAR